MIHLYKEKEKGCGREARKETCTCLGDRGQVGGLEAGDGVVEGGSEVGWIKVPLGGKPSLWCPLYPISVTRQMLAVTSSRFQPPSPPSHTPNLF